jgi:hypothetical protein
VKLGEAEGRPEISRMSQAKFGLIFAPVWRLQDQPLRTGQRARPISVWRFRVDF